MRFFARVDGVKTRLLGEGRVHIVGRRVGLTELLEEGLPVDRRDAIGAAIRVETGVQAMGPDPG